MRIYLCLSIATLLAELASAFTLRSVSKVPSSCRLGAISDQSNVLEDSLSRRKLLLFVPSAFLTSHIVTLPTDAVAATGPNDGNLPDLPSDAVRSYLQYRIALQLAADFYIFELQNMLGDVDQWGEVGQLFQTQNSRGGQGQPNRIERDFVNPMRVLLLSMPPDVTDDMRAAQFRFESAMSKISKATGGYRRDLPVEISKSEISAAKDGWEEGRVALNAFFVLLNDATGLQEMKKIPPAGPNQKDEYGRSAKRYFELVKKTKLCQNRGGPTLSQAWGQLMVSGYMQDSCGIPDLDSYFFQ